MEKERQYLLVREFIHRKYLIIINIHTMNEETQNYINLQTAQNRKITDQIIFYIKHFRELVKTES